MTAREELIQHIAQAIGRGDVVVNYTKCWSCMLGQCPGGSHDWADTVDIEHALDTGQADPTGDPCSCRCSNDAPYDLDPPDMDQQSTTSTPCVVCGEPGACAYDAEGRALIHTTEDEDER